MLTHPRQLGKTTIAFKRFFATDADSAGVLNRWLKGFDGVPPVPPQLPGDAPPTALSWARRRGPALPIALLHRLFREETVRVWDPTTGKVKRAKKDSLLPQGARLLLPKLSPSQNDTDDSEDEEAAYSPARQEAMQRAAMALRGAVILQNPEFWALNKPPGLAVQGGTRVERGMSIDRLLPLAFPYKPSNLVHRLDKDASGVLLVAKGPDAAARLSIAFRDKSMKAAANAGAVPASSSSRGQESSSKGAGALLPEVDKMYWAVVCTSASSPPLIPGKTGVINAPAGGATAAESSSAALTKYRVLEARGPLAWLQLEPLTGRKHQLRQHCAWGLGAAILGDHKYGKVRAMPQSDILSEITQGEGGERGRRAASLPLFLHCRSMVVKEPGRRGVAAVAEPPLASWGRLFARQGWRLPSTSERAKSRDRAFSSPRR